MVSTYVIGVGHENSTFGVITIFAYPMGLKTDKKSHCQLTSACTQQMQRVLKSCTQFTWRELFFSGKKSGFALLTCPRGVNNPYRSQQPGPVLKQHLHQQSSDQHQRSLADNAVGIGHQPDPWKAAVHSDQHAIPVMSCGVVKENLRCGDFFDYCTIQHSPSTCSKAYQSFFSYLFACLFYSFIVYLISIFLFFFCLSFCFYIFFFF